jgi:hypothetical protein
MSHIDDINYRKVRVFWSIIIVSSVAIGVLCVPFIFAIESVVPLLIVIICIVLIFASISGLKKADIERGSGNPPKLPWKF